MKRLDSLAGILNFFIPAEVLSAVLLVFTMENVLDYIFTAYVPSGLQGVGWILIYLLGAVAISVLNYATADEDDLDDLNDDIDRL